MNTAIENQYEVLKKPYEVSLWDDVPAWAVLLEGEDTPNTWEKSLAPIGEVRPIVGRTYKDKTITAVKQYLKEEKICIIGAHDMESLARIVNPTLTTNINAATTFTFTMYYQYEDWKTGETVKNPFWDYIVNERKVKLKYGDDWYDFIIKSIKEDTDKKSIEVTAKDLAVVELSKTGFDVEFDEVLGNNLDEAGALVEKIVDGTDWEYDDIRSDKFWQTRDETVYIGKLGKDWNVWGGRPVDIYKINDHYSGDYVEGAPHGEISNITDDEKVNAEDFVDGYIFLFYSCVSGKTSFYQFLLCNKDDVAHIEQDEDLVITNLDSYYVLLEENVDGKKKFISECLNEETGFPITNAINWEESPSNEDLTGINQVSTQYMGRRRVRTQRGCYDSGLERYVYEYDYNPETPQQTEYTYDLNGIISIADHFLNAKPMSAASYSKTDNIITMKTATSLNCSFNNKSTYKHNTIFIKLKDVPFFREGWKIEYQVKISDSFFVKDNNWGIGFTAWAEGGKRRILASDDHNHFKEDSLPEYSYGNGYAVLTFSANKIKKQLSDYDCSIEDIDTLRFYFNYLDNGDNWENWKSSQDPVPTSFSEDRLYQIESTDDTETILDDSGNIIITFSADKDYEFDNYRRGYTSSNYVTKDLAQNFIANAEDFSCGDLTKGSYDSESFADGWTSGTNSDNTIKINRTNEDISIISDEEIDGKIGLEFDFNAGGYLYNSALYSNAARIGPLTKGERYVFDWACTGASIRNKETGNPYTPAGKHTIYLAYFDINSDGDYLIKKVVGSVTNDMGEDDEKEDESTQPVIDDNTKIAKSYFVDLNGKKYKRYVRILTISKSIPLEDLSNGRVGLFIKGFSDKTIVMFQCRFFKYIPYNCTIKGWNNSTINLPYLDPDFYFNEDIEDDDYLKSIAQVLTRYNYYDPNQSRDYDKNTIIYEYSDYEDSIEYIPRYTYNKIRSIQASESNRFNIIQSICETFECWSKFVIDHEANGEIKPKFLITEDNKIDIDYPKRIILREYIGKENDAGFKYGINLKSIQRTVDSESIATKVIVKPNANENALNGSCQIQRAYSNPILENYVLNFDHYINTGLLNRQEVINDFYTNNDDEGYLGLYVKLRKLNKNNNELIQKQTDAYEDLRNAKADYTAYELLQKESADKFDEARTYYKKITGGPDDGLDWPTKYTPQNGNKVPQEIEDSWNETQYQKMQEVAAANKLPLLQNEIDTYEGILYEIDRQIDDIVAQKEALETDFEKKYGRYVQEGSWISEDYMDDELYYFDAVSTTHTSANPKISYTINVLELSQLDRYKDYTFGLGDISYIEDIDFFGYCQDGTGRPYHEEVIISEIKVALDSPESNTLKIQNYKTQFDDLFQRIAASTQTVEFKGGQYARAASAITTDGIIQESALVGVLADGSLTIGNANTDSVVWGPDGITVRAAAANLTNRTVKIKGNGIYLYTDGGTTFDLKMAAEGFTGSLKVSGWLQIGESIKLEGSSLTLGEEDKVHSILTSESLKFFNDEDTDWFNLSGNILRLGDADNNVTINGGSSPSVVITKNNINWFNLSGNILRLGDADNNVTINGGSSPSVVIGKKLTLQSSEDSDKEFSTTLTTSAPFLLKTTGDEIRIKATGEDSVMELTAYPYHGNTSGYTSRTSIYFTGIKNIAPNGTNWTQEHPCIQFQIVDGKTSSQNAIGSYYFTSGGIYYQKGSGTLTSLITF